MRTFRQGESQLARHPIRTALGITAIGTAAIFGHAIATSVMADGGRGAEITACPTDYDGVVKVDDTAILDLLGRSAEVLDIRDPEASGGITSDRASLPGELACKAFADDFSDRTIIVLLPEGMEALDRSGSYALHPGVNGTASFPDSLSWR